MSVLLKREIFARLKASPKIAQLERGRTETQTSVGPPQSRGWIQDSTQRQNHRKENLQTQTPTQQWFTACQVLCWVLSPWYLSSSQHCCKAGSNTDPVLQVKEVMLVQFPQGTRLEWRSWEWKTRPAASRGSLLICALR